MHHIVVHQDCPSMVTPNSSTSFVTSTVRSTNALNDARRNRASTALKCTTSLLPETVISLLTLSGCNI
uniref:Uncharacterized protein n=1 Tax=Arundo donax TaxID=35708 RepID=A0A0A9H6A8_ARUDO